MSVNTTPRVFQLALQAAREACAAKPDSRVGPVQRIDVGNASSRTALVVGTSKGNIDAWLTPKTTRCAPAVLSDLEDGKFGLGDLAADLSRELGISGPCLTLSGACASSIHALIRGVLLIRHGDADRVLVVAAESSLHPLFIGSFKRLGVLARPGDGCRPFDENRSGFLMSEAAAAVMLEADGDLRPGSASEAASNPVYIENVSLAGDAAHLTAGDRDGRVLKHLLDHVLQGKSADLVHAHGTGTITNDPIELAAIDKAFSTRAGVNRPSIYSHKGALGHSLGAAGLIAVILNARMHREGVVLPNIRTDRPLQTQTQTVMLSSRPVRRAIMRSIAMAAGFGGACGAVSLISE